jgi:hypothetical protein
MMKHKSALFIAAIVMLMPIGLLPRVAAAEGVRVSGTKASLAPPIGFSPAPRFPGFQRDDAQAAIMVSELPAPVDELLKGMTSAALASRGMRLIKSTPETVAGRPARLLQVAQSAGGLDVLKWILITGNAKNSLVIVGTFPKSAPGQTGEAIRQSLLSTEWSPESTLDLFEGLRFRVTPTAQLKLAGRVSNLLMLTESGKMGALPDTEAFYVVGSSVRKVPIGDLQLFSEQRARSTTLITDLQNFRGRRIQVGGLAAYELEMTGKDVKTGRLMRLYQVIAQEPEGYVIIQGQVPETRSAALLTEFRRITESFRQSP